MDCAYSDGEKIKFAEDEGLDLYVPSRAGAGINTNKNLNHHHYEYDEERNEIIVEYVIGLRHMDGRVHCATFYNPQIKKKRYSLF